MNKALKDLIDRLKIIEFRLSKYAITTSIKEEIHSIIEGLETLALNPFFMLLWSRQLLNHN